MSCIPSNWRLQAFYMRHVLHQIEGWELFKEQVFHVALEHNRVRCWCGLGKTQMGYGTDRNPKGTNYWRVEWLESLFPSWGSMAGTGKVMAGCFPWRTSNGDRRTNKCFCDFSWLEPSLLGNSGNWTRDGKWDKIIITMHTSHRYTTCLPKKLHLLVIR